MQHFHQPPGRRQQHQLVGKWQGDPQIILFIEGQPVRIALAGLGRCVQLQDVLEHRIRRHRHLSHPGDGGAETELFLTVNNLLDRDPPLIPGTIPGLNLPTIISLYDTVGRAYTFGVRARF
ncbi:hypothetical protein [Niveispirillum fermenti]|uniref:hypothetical protein n=1 Tax=Niveispirillum fermenti TaxID=1233113 RepID=UPI003A8A6224